jgi:DNA polymerase III subunit delta
VKAREFLADVKIKKLAPIVVLHGEESYFIDLISDYISQTLLDESEKEFNETIVYGKDASAENIIAIARSYPMMAERRVVIIKEAQAFKDLEKLEAYFNKPVSSTTLVICYKYGQLDKRKKVFKSLLTSKNAKVFESNFQTDLETVDWIKAKFSQKKIQIHEKAAFALIDLIGNDLNKLSNEIDKMAIALGPGVEIRLEAIADNVGMNRDYNIFELQKALSSCNRGRVFKIASYAYANPNEFSLPAVTAILYGFYSKLMWANQLVERDKAAVNNLGYTVKMFDKKELSDGLKNYNFNKCWRNVRLLQEYDLRGKGVNNGSADHKGLLSELLFKLMY